MTKPEDKRNPAYASRMRVYWEDTDAGGVVYYANYLKFMERCRTDWLRFLGIDQHGLRLERQIQFAVVSVVVDFLKPAVLDDEILVTAELVRLSGATIWFKQAVMRESRAADRCEHTSCLSRFRHAEAACHPQGSVHGVA